MCKVIYELVITNSKKKIAKSSIHALSVLFIQLYNYYFAIENEMLL